MPEWGGRTPLVSHQPQAAAPNVWATVLTGPQRHLPQHRSDFGGPLRASSPWSCQANGPRAERGPMPGPKPSSCFSEPAFPSPKGFFPQGISFSERPGPGCCLCRPSPPRRRGSRLQRGNGTADGGRASGSRAGRLPPRPGGPPGLCLVFPGVVSPVPPFNAQTPRPPLPPPPDIWRSQSAARRRSRPAGPPREPAPRRPSPPFLPSRRGAWLGGSAVCLRGCLQQSWMAQGWGFGVFISCWGLRRGAPALPPLPTDPPSVLPATALAPAVRCATVGRRELGAGVPRWGCGGLRAGGPGLRMAMRTGTRHTGACTLLWLLTATTRDQWPNWWATPSQGPQVGWGRVGG